CVRMYFSSRAPRSSWLRCSRPRLDRKSTRLNSSHQITSYAVFCLKKKKWPDRYGARCAATHIGPMPGPPPPCLMQNVLCRFRLQTSAPIFFFNDTATTEIYTLSLLDALPI